MNDLYKLHEDIDDRVRTILEDRSDWLCRLGCDGCCRRLAEIPRLSAAEWERLKEGLAALPSAQLGDIGRDINALAGQLEKPVVCPMLDREAGACCVYAHRPVACRTYGFYVQRDKGLYCQDIASRVEAGTWSDVVWGNHDAIDRRLSTLGDSRDLTEWFALWQADSDYPSAR